MEYRIGVDFDNTLISYDKLIHAIALERGLIRPDTHKNKKTIRDAIRQLPDGEAEWQRLQAILYGPRMEEATLARGVRAFFDLGKRRQARVYIISHKTEYAAYGEIRTNLRVAALDWMQRHDFFKADGLRISPQDVFFTSTRPEKIARIKQLRCTHFIDDLEETFIEDSFPTGVERILYIPLATDLPSGGVRSFSTWKDISQYVFGTKR